MTRRQRERCRTTILILYSDTVIAILHCDERRAGRDVIPASFIVRFYMTVAGNLVKQTRFCPIRSTEHVVLELPLYY
jgi:hypothetical protein